MHVIDKHDLPVVIADESGFELRLREEGDMIVNFVTAPVGTDMAPMFVGLPDDRCQCQHWGFVLKGRIYTDGADGRTEYAAGDVFYWAPGHVPGILEDAEYVDFAPKQEFMHLMEHVAAKMAEAAAAETAGASE
jgi:hypothetical protein